LRSFSLQLLTLRFTRGTAKKFLAAANFIDVLKVFNQPDLVESVRIFLSLMYTMIYELKIYT
jgi:hypothetical protein